MTSPFRKIQLTVATPPEWAAVALSDLDAFLQDHASCERKASAVGMSFVTGYPERTLLLEPMIQFAREELDHFHQVFRIMESRGVTLGNDSEDRYVAILQKEVRSGREERFLDRLLVSALIEARSHERLTLVTEALTDREVQQFYQRLTRAEDRHKDLFLDLAALYFPSDVIQARFDYFLERESHAIQSVPFRSAMH